MKIKINPEVQNAIKNGLPVVALESTIISHGMPYPKNVKTALAVEDTIRQNGAIPATIGIINGEAVIGMNNEEIELFGKRGGILKVSRRDLAYVFAKKEWGATTVATTSYLASISGIKVFVTGGIGGVHRNGENTMDISADLQELANTSIVVVCAGIKAILDLPKTLEYLETMGVPVLGYRSDELPNFYTPHSGLKVDYRVDSPSDIASIFKEQESLQLKGGILVTNPIKEEDAIDQKEIDKAISNAITEMNEKGIIGKEQTPFLLKRVSELTNGESLESNIKLVLNNATLGAKIAVEYEKIK